MKKIIILFTLAITAASCSKDAERYYENIKNMPEILANYDLVYQTGDSVTIKGRLNPDNGLSITIGGVPANYRVVGRQSVMESDKINPSMDEVRFAVTEAMGSGQQAVIVTSGGRAINGPSIEIIQAKGLINGTLLLAQHGTINSGDVVFYCQNGKGDVYLYRNSNKTIQHIKKDGSTETVLTLTGLSDTYGTYTISALYSGGVDGKGEYIYFSALTPDNSADNAGNDIYRLVRYKFGSQQPPETLNRSLYYTLRQRDRTLETIKPFEGNIKNVKIYRTGGIYPDSEGNVYIHIPHAVGLLSASGNFRYLFRIPGGNLGMFLQIWNPAESDFYGPTAFFNLLPGVIIDGQHGTIAPDDKLMYSITTPSIPATEANRTNIKLFDLATRSQAYSYIKPAFNGSFGIKQYPIGPFNILTGVRFGGAGYGKSHDQTGFLPLRGKKLLLLHYGETYTIMDFDREYANKYATVEMADAALRLEQFTDIGLNTDEEGMIYTVANNGTLILKTRVK